MPTTDTPQPPLLLGIGAVSRLTGIPVHTLRVWERRYGTPTPSRTEGGHRLYAQETVRRLTLVARALEAGLRPRQALAASPAEIEALLDSEPNPPRPEALGPPPGQPDGLEPWLAAAQALDASALDAAMRRDHARLGTLGFLQERVPRFLEGVGALWAAGGLTTAQEHHASLRLVLLLQQLRRDLEPAEQAPTAVVAGLPGEQHLLGVEMVATALAATGWRVVDLGGDLPVEDILKAVAQVRARALAISISVTADPVTVRAHLSTLAARLPAAVARWMGGAGAPVAHPGWERPGDMEALAARARLMG